MADKLAEQIVAALSVAVTDPGGVALYRSKTDPGLFPATSTGRPAAQKALADGLLTVVATPKPGKELAAVTSKGLAYLADRACPKQVLDDFVRALERREADVASLATGVAQLTQTLASLKTAVEMVLPTVTAARVSRPSDPEPAVMPAVVGSARPVPLAGLILGRLTDWAASAVAGQDCPLPELYRSLSTLETPPTLGAFHDCLRELHAARKIYLHPWTGPLYAIPDPECALLSGHNIAYYASPRHG